jgi:hypothetical protein
LQGLISASTRLFRPIPLSLPVGRFRPGLSLQTGLQPYFQASCPFLSPLAPPIRRSYRPSPTRCLHIWSIHRSFLYPLLVLLFSALLSRTRYFSVAEEPHYYYMLMKVPTVCAPGRSGSYPTRSLAVSDPKYVAIATDPSVDQRACTHACERMPAQGLTPAPARSRCRHCCDAAIFVAVT